MLTREALSAQSGRCFYCKDPLQQSDATAEHLIPRSRRGPTDRKNIKAACFRCNNVKADMHEGTFFKLIDGKKPPSKVRTAILLIWASRRIFRRMELACKRIMKATA